MPDIGANIRKALSILVVKNGGKWSQLVGSGIWERAEKNLSPCYTPNRFQCYAGEG